MAMPLSSDRNRTTGASGPNLPRTGTAGDVFIVPEAAAEHANALALWDGEPGTEDWVFFTPQEGWEVHVADEARHVRFDGTAWLPVPRPGIVTIRTLTATAHVLEPVDAGCILETTGSAPVTVTIPAAADTPFETGTLINLTQVGTGIATVAAAAGVSLNGVSSGSVAVATRWSGVALTCRGTDAWIVQGALAGEVT